MPPNTQVLLYHEPLSAILARVAYRMIETDYHADIRGYSTPAAAIGRLSRQLQRDGFPGLSLWVAAYGFHLRRGVSTAAYKQRVVRRARWAAMNREFGKPWARVPGQ